jgi:hypothetical protein
MKTKVKKGGKREGSGRKPIDISQRKETVILYVTRKDIDQLGGDETVRLMCYDFLKLKLK